MNPLKRALKTIDFGPTYSIPTTRYKRKENTFYKGTIDLAGSAV
jgi:hypothetical protein